MREELKEQLEKIVEEIGPLEFSANNGDGYHCPYCDGARPYMLPNSETIEGGHYPQCPIFKLTELVKNI